MISDMTRTLTQCMDQGLSIYFATLIYHDKSNLKHDWVVKKVEQYLESNLCSVTFKTILPACIRPEMISNLLYMRDGQ